ncbi:MAG: hypothetical protein GX804_00750 [Lentisphaerae bacterium]|jgi:hypothetical protein|nr:hypothetical protein [Lentisphaerota bacterium]
MRDTNTEEDSKSNKNDFKEDFESMVALSRIKDEEESFPVLRAFQQFLESEREIARKRQLMLTAGFLGAIVALVLLFSIIGVILFSKIISHGTRQQDRMFELLASREGVVEKVVPEAVPVTAKIETDPVLAELLEELRLLREEKDAAEKLAGEKRLLDDKSVEEDVEELSSEEVKPSREEIWKSRGIYSSLPKRHADVDTVDAVEKPADEVKSGHEVKESELLGEAVAEPIHDDAKIAAAGSNESAHTETAIAANIGPEEVMSSDVDTEGESNRIKFRQVRVMKAPEGFRSADISLVTSDRRKVPWRIVMPIESSHEEGLVE